ncbi:hypothetical protein AVEN_20943-1 [Araneus ventricosus]|uniref:Uncharacterized protein n=1 Tax=Araneus ventricosus TaxID=182803 RepID=A0A4Y2KNX1_ARAVE|nr:hypothetical protein AVEN_20943-1 [Araneus ventricosus]
MGEDIEDERADNLMELSSKGLAMSNEEDTIPTFEGELLEIMEDTFPTQCSTKIRWLPDFHNRRSTPCAVGLPFSPPVTSKIPAQATSSHSKTPPLTQDDHHSQHQR